MYQFLVPAIQKLPHNQGLKETEICSLTFLEATVSKSRHWQGYATWIESLEGWRGGGQKSQTAFLPLLISRFPWLVTASLTSQPLSPHYLLLFFLLNLPLCLFYNDIYYDIQIHPDIPEQSPYLHILNLITSEKTLYPNKVTFTGFGDQILVSIISLSR